MNGFHEIALGDVLTFQRGFDITKSGQSAGEVPIVSSSGVSSYHNKWKVKGPGVIIGRKGTLGTVHYIREHYWPHDTTLWIRDFKGNDPRFLSYFLQTLKLENFDVGASNPTLNRNHIHKLRVIFPTQIEAQRRIAAILSAHDELIEHNKRRILLLETLADQIYREWFVRLRFPGHETSKLVKGIPSDWKVRKIGQIFDTSSGGTPSRKNASNYGEDICWVKTGELKHTFVLDTEEKLSRQGLDSSAAKIFPRHTVVIAMYCAMPDISILAVDSATNQACCAFFPKVNYLHYAYTYLLIKFAQRHLINFSHGAAQQNLSQDLIQDFPLLIPTEELITAFAKLAEPMFGLVEQLMKANACLEMMRDRLLPRLLSGRLAVAGLNIQFPPSMAGEADEERTHAHA
jgi:type I restriction enzyme S subunit